MTADLEALLQGLRARRGERTVPSHADPFAGLPARAAVEAQRGVLASLGLESPYYRLAEAPPGPEGVVDGRPQSDFTGYDYLGLNAVPAVREAAAAAAHRWGVSAGASRLAGGDRPYHRSLERALAAMQGTESALALVSGHATNVSTLAALLGPGDLVVLDAFAHNSLVEGARICGATRLVMPHNDLDWLDRTLAERRAAHRHVLIAVEGLYSMDGDSPDLAGLLEIRRRHRVWVMVDEAHALGTLGATGRGTAEAQGVDPAEIDVWMGTLSKSLASCGGYVCGSRVLVEHLKAQAPGFVYSVGMAAPVAAAAEAALSAMLAEPWRVARLRALSRHMLVCAKDAGLDTGRGQGTAILPVMTGDSLTAVRTSAALREAGFNALPVVHPAVPERAARLRFFVTARHTEAQIEAAVDATAAALRRA